MVTKKEFELLQLENHDLRNRIHELTLHKDLTSQLLDSVDKVNGDLNEEYKELSPPVDDVESKLVKGDGAFQILEKTKSKIFMPRHGVIKDDKDMKFKRTKSCFHCGSVMPSLKQLQLELDLKLAGSGGE